MIQSPAPLSAPLPPALVQRYRQLFRFYDRQALCSAVIATLWEKWQWTGTCGFALVLASIALVLERSTWWCRWRPG